MRGVCDILELLDMCFSHDAVNKGTPGGHRGILNTPNGPHTSVGFICISLKHGSKSSKHR